MIMLYASGIAPCGYKNREDEPIQAIIHIYIYMYLKETPCVPILNKQKCHCFLLQKQRIGEE
jgi:hypothetical protein